MKKTGNKNLKIVAGTMMVIFSLFTCFSGAFAWFTGIRNQNKDVDDFEVGIREYFSKISYHQFTGNPTDSNCSFNKKPIASLTYNPTTREFNKPVNGDGEEINSFKFQLDTYDPMNKHKPMLVLAELSEDVDTSRGNVTALANTTTDGFLGKKDSENLPYYNLDHSQPNLIVETVNEVDYYPLSSVVNFKSMAFSQDEFDDWDGESSTYDITISETSDPIDHNFVTVDNNLDVSHFYQESHIYDSGFEATVKYIAIVVDYNDAAIEYIYSTFLGDDAMESREYLLDFVCDWKWEIG